MNSKQQQNILHKYLTKIKKGELSKEEVLGYLKTHNEALHDLLKKALLLEQYSQATLSQEYKTASKNRIFYTLLQEVEIPAERPYRETTRRNIFGTFRPRLQPFLTAALVIIITFGTFVGGAQAADAAAPGDFLYGVDRGLENIRLNLTTNEKARLQLLLEFSDERIVEAEEQFREGHAEHGQMALNEYKLEVQAVNDLISQADPALQQELQASAAQANAHNQEVLKTLLASGQIPAQAQEAINHALEVSGHTPNPNKPESPSSTDDGDDDPGELEEATKEAEDAAAEEAEAEQEAADEAAEAEQEAAEEAAEAEQEAAEEEAEAEQEAAEEAAEEEAEAEEEAAEDAAEATQEAQEEEEEDNDNDGGGKPKK